MGWLLVIVLIGSKGVLLHSEPALTKSDCERRIPQVQAQFAHTQTASQCVDIKRYVDMVIEDEQS